MIDERGYYSTKDMVKRYRRSARTIYRWVEKGILPPPDIRQTGCEMMAKVLLSLKSLDKIDVILSSFCLVYSMVYSN